MARFELSVTTSSATLAATVDTLEDARALAASFPKALKMRGNLLSTLEDGKSVHRGYTSAAAMLRPDDVNGGANESGIARIRKAAAKAIALGHEVVYVERFANALTEEEWLAL